MAPLLHLLPTLPLTSTPQTSAPSFPCPTLLMLVGPGSPHPLSSPLWFHLQIDSCVAPPSPLYLFPGIFLRLRLPHPTEVFLIGFLNISPFCAVSFLKTGNRSDFTSGFLNLAQNPLSGFWAVQKYQLIQTQRHTNYNFFLDCCGLRAGFLLLTVKCIDWQ